MRWTSISQRGPGAEQPLAGFRVSLKKLPFSRHSWVQGQQPLAGFWGVPKVFTFFQSQGGLRAAVPGGVVRLLTAESVTQ
jgi:hypothetical protein